MYPVNHTIPHFDSITLEYFEAPTACKGLILLGNMTKDNTLKIQIYLKTVCVAC